MFNRICGLLLLFACLLFVTSPASAQDAPAASTYGLSIDKFPQISLFLDLRDANGRFIHGLDRSQVQVIEDGRTLPVASLQELRQGVQFVVAINPGPTFAVRNSRGQSRYDLLVERLGTWAKNRQGSTIDDWSLISAGGAELLHTSDPMNWYAALTGAQVDAREADPNLDILVRAVEIAAQTPPREGMGRAVLFITPPIEGEQFQLATQNLMPAVLEQGVRISIWTVVPEGAPTTPAMEAMAQFARQTGGGYAAFSSEENLPQPEDFLEPLRSIYQISYFSTIRESGTHQVSLQITTEAGEITTPAHEFMLDIQAPQPVFITPPVEVSRVPPQDRGSRPVEDIALEEYTPTELDLQILVDFPDGRMRALTSTRLYVDGALVDENREEPFDELTWNLRDYQADGTHTLRVEAEDILGLTGTSIDTFVQLNIEQPAQNPLTAISSNTPVLVGLIVLMSGATLLLVLIMGGQIQPHIWGRPRKPAFNFYLRRFLPQPSASAGETPSEKRVERRLPGWVNRIQWPQRRITPRAHAFLSRTSEGSPVSADTPIPITADEVTLGSDPNLAMLVLSDPSVDGLHARLIRTEEGIFYLFDQDSTAGSWVNYALAGPEGTPLSHGDVIHLGRVSFRFTLQQPGPSRKPVIRAVPGRTANGSGNGVKAYNGAGEQPTTSAEDELQ